MMSPTKVLHRIHVLVGFPEISTLALMRASQHSVPRQLLSCGGAFCAPSQTLRALDMLQTNVSSFDS